MKINVRETDSAVILEATGRITLGASGPSLQDGVRELLHSGHKNIILDLGGVTFLDSSGLGQLVGSYATTVSHGGEIRLLNLNQRVYDLMQITKLYTVFRFLPMKPRRLRASKRHLYQRSSARRQKSDPPRVSAGAIE